MSKDLNDAWMESVETMRLLGVNYPGILRRLVNAVAISGLTNYGRWQSETKELLLEPCPNENILYDHTPPYCSCTIIIGRRSMLDSEALFRTARLSASTGHTINVATYDYFLEKLYGAAEGSLFSSGLFW
jgi:hypothetical protein